MTEPLHAVDFGQHTTPPDRPLRWYRRTVTRVGRVSRVGVARLTRPARLLPALLALGCAVAGSFVLWGLGVALLVAAGCAAWIDARL